MHIILALGRQRGVDLHTHDPDSVSGPLRDPVSQNKAESNSERHLMLTAVLHRISNHFHTHTNPYVHNTTTAINKDARSQEQSWDTSKHSWILTQDSLKDVLSLT